jgi:hypothetical protein
MAADLSERLKSQFRMLKTNSVTLTWMIVVAVISVELFEEAGDSTQDSVQL